MSFKVFHEGKHTTIPYAPETVLIDLHKQACKYFSLDQDRFTLAIKSINSNATKNKKNAANAAGAKASSTSAENKTLDLSAPVRLQRVPRDAHLILRALSSVEMEVKKKPVKVMITANTSLLITEPSPDQQTAKAASHQDTKELVHSFNPQATLWSILNFWESRGEKFTNVHDIPSPEKNALFEIHVNIPSYMQPTILYLNKKINTNNELKKTTLASMGINMLTCPNGVKMSLSLVYTRPKLTQEQQAATVANFQTKFAERVKEMEEQKKKVAEQLEELETDGEEEESEESVNYEEETAVSIPSDRHRKVYYAPPGPLDPRIFEVEEEFYDVTPADVKRYSKSILATAAVDTVKKSLDKSSKTVSNFKMTTIRVRLPNRILLEGKFNSEETVGNLRKFIMDSIDYKSDKPFELFVTPPRQILRDDETFASTGLVPAAIVSIKMFEEKTDFLKKGLEDLVIDLREKQVHE